VLRSTARVVLGVVLAAVGIAIAVEPQFTHCTGMGGKVPGCLDSVTAELVLGIVLALAGVAIAVLSSRIAGIVLGAVSIVVSALAIAFPVGITGTCAMSKMVCNTTMKPLTILLGAVGVALSLAVLLVSLSKRSSGSGGA
jgi:hypothetical protein